MTYDEKECLISLNFHCKEVQHPASTVVSGERNTSSHCESSPLCWMQILREKSSLDSGAQL